METSFTSSEAAQKPLLNKDDKPTKQHQQLKTWMAMVFIAGEMGGIGLLTLPKAVADSSWAGLLVLVLSGVAQGWCGALLGKCWLMIEERHATYRTQCRDPYASIAYESFGKHAKRAVYACIYISSFGTSVVYTIAASQGLYGILYEVEIANFSTCYCIIILAVVLTPFMWLGTPKNFWPVAVGSTLSSMLASALLIDALLSHPSATTPAQAETHSRVTLESTAFAFGTISFAYGCTAAFPTIQHDMERPAEFSKALVVGFLITIFTYFPPTMVAYLVLGGEVSDNLLQVFQQDAVGKTWIYYTIQILISAHLLLAVVIYINPVCQQLEDLLQTPQEFTWKRMLLRTLVAAMLLFVAESMPNFGPVMSLLGGSAITFLCIVFPCVFYLRLSSMTSPEWPVRPAYLHEKIFCVEMILVGIVMGLVTTYSSTKSLIRSFRFIPPCYINPDIGPLDK